MEFTVDSFSSERRIRQAGTARVFEVGFEGGTRMSLHHHPYPCLSLPMSGGFTETVGGRELIARAGTLLAKPAGVEHTDEWGRAGSRQIVIVPAPGRHGEPEGVWAGLVSEPGLRVGAHWMVTARRLVQEVRLSDDLTGLGVEMAVADATEAEAGRAETGPAAARVVARALELVHARFAQRGLTTEELAREVGVSRPHLARIFRSVEGWTLTDAIRRLRVEHAACLRLTTGHTLSRIAIESGFADQSHMTREFRRVLGTTPGRYPRRDGVARA